MHAMTNNGNNSEYTQVDLPIFQAFYEVVPVQSLCNSITYKNKMIIIFKKVDQPDVLQSANDDDEG